MPTPEKFPTAKERKIFGITKYKGINTKAQRPAIDDEEFFWLQNYMPIGDGNLRTLWGNGTAVYTATGVLTILSFSCFNIGTNNFAAVFLSDGTADQVNLNNLVVTSISAIPGTFSNGTVLPDIAQWGNSGILIVSTVGASALWAWDGTLYSPGVASPAWLNGGTPTAMPSGVSGSAIETYQSRAWIVNGPVVTFSAPSNGADYSAASGGGTFTSSDSFLRHNYTAIRQANGFLYVFGDSSVNVISNVQTSGTPPTTTFNNQNVDPQVGTAWHSSVQAFGRGLIYANPSGVYALYGGAAEKVSDQLDGIFASANFTSGVVPTAAVATIFGIRIYMLLISMLDINGLQKNIMCMWDGKKWFLGSQDITLSLVAPNEIDSILTSYGATSTKIHKMFSTQSETLTKSFETKFWGGDGFILQKKAYRLYNQIRDIAGTGVTMTGSIDADIGPENITVNTTASSIIFTNAGGFPINFTNATGGIIIFSVANLTSNYQNCQAYGNLLGLTMNSNSSDFVLIAMALLYNEHAPLGG